jgi:uncharacterized protein (DUF697 family)
MHEFDIPAFPHETESYEFSYPRVLSESQELELAAQLMEVNSEQELEQFLGDLIKKAGSVIGGLIRSPIGQSLTGALKGAAKQLLPMAGQALGGAIGGSTGSQIGGQLASAAGSVFGLELEASEQEFEAAQSFVRLAADAVKNAAAAPPGANPHAVAREAIMQAAQVHAPGLFGNEPTVPSSPQFGGSAGRGQTGRWVRHGNKVILFGA